METVKAYGIKQEKQPLEPLSIHRREIQPGDVHIEILYCGICHSDLHNGRNDWGRTNYPIVPGHEIVGKVLEVGKEVGKFKQGDLVGVGCMVDSCRHCSACEAGLENYCLNGNTMTYGAPDKYLGGRTFGGYSERIVVDQDFVLTMPEGLDISKAAPLLCAGITTYSPLKHWNCKKGDQVAVVGMGGLGHVAVKIAHAMGAHVVMITTSPEKGRDAQLLGADEVLLSDDLEAMKKQNDRFDLILNTIPVGHDLDPYVRLLKIDGTMVLLGAIEPLTNMNGGLLIRGRRQVAGSLIGGIKETQEMLDFCAKHQILPEVEMIRIQDINEAWDRMKRGDVHYRFVIDMASLKS